MLKLPKPRITNINLNIFPTITIYQNNIIWQIDYLSNRNYNDRIMKYVGIVNLFFVGDSLLVNVM